jgi:hypothetical protein
MASKQKTSHTEWAVWPYDLYPYVLTAEIHSKIEDDTSGMVKVYGGATIVKPTVIVDEATGQKLAEVIEHLLMLERETGHVLKALARERLEEIIDGE